MSLLLGDELDVDFQVDWNPPTPRLCQIMQTKRKDMTFAEMEALEEEKTRLGLSLESVGVMLL
jgi:hypothetical protein